MLSLTLPAAPPTSAVAPPAPASPTPVRNRRGWRRRPAKRSTRAACHKMGLGPDLGLSVLDLSETGVRLLIKAPLRRGQEIEVTLDGAAVPRPLRLRAEVVWSLPASDGNHCIGVRFNRSLGYGDLQALASA